MRKSAAVKLTLVPLLAASALAQAQAPGETPPVTPEPSAPEVGTPLPFEWSEGAPDDIEWTLSPPGLTPTRVVPPCDEDPYAPVREECADATIHDGHGSMRGTMIIRGGFGGHFGGHSGTMGG